MATGRSRSRRRLCRAVTCVCDIKVMHGTPGGAFRHAFRHGGTYPAERDAMIEGLRAGMTWIELKMSKAFNL